MSNKKIIDLSTKARPVRTRDQQEILAERRKRRTEKINTVKSKFRTCK
ncbi:hypothetical protein KO561_07165 [Radiobacillus kanasensis]|nr:hypothetical protein [Radiobacillus kanasensis]UFU00707.1 hypothetical protein KO561_07165 [Radiobacillus kanasensis]